jgi:hypothetical protein
MKLQINVLFLKRMKHAMSRQIDRVAKDGKIASGSWIPDPGK